MTPDPGLDATFIEVVIDGDTRRFPLSENPVCSVGRDSRNTVVLTDDIMVSRKHALIQRERTGKFYLSDLGSRNGTTLNGLPVTTPTPLHDGDSFTIGSHVFSFHHREHSLRSETVYMADPTAVQVVRRVVTILVVDLRNYTGLSRALGESGISQMMNEFFRASGRLLKTKGSWSQKYIGDAVMAAWIHDDEPGGLAAGNVGHGDDARAVGGPGEARAALIPVLESLSGLTSVIADLDSRFDLPEPLAFGAGVNTGVAVTGNMGSSGLVDHTAMGDAVNKAFRLESVSKEIGRDVVFGKPTFELLSVPEAGEIFSSHTVTLKGYEQAEDVFGMALGDLGPLLRILRGA